MTAERREPQVYSCIKKGVVLGKNLAKEGCSSEKLSAWYRKQALTNFSFLDKRFKLIWSCFVLNSKHDQKGSHFHRGSMRPCWISIVPTNFSKGGHSRDTIRGSPTIYGLYRCSPSCISGLSRIIAEWRPILTKDKSRWRNTFQKNKS